MQNEHGGLGELMTKRDIARMLKVDQRTVERWIRSGTFPQPTRFGKLVRWPEPVVREAMAVGFKPR